MSVTRKLFKWGLLCGAAFLVVVIIALVGVRIYLSTEGARERIQAEIETAIPGSVTWADWRFSVFGGQLELTDLVLAGPDGERIAGFDRFFVDLSPSTLIRGTLTVAELTVESPWAELKRDESGRLNLLSALPSGGPTAPPEEPRRDGGTEPPVDLAVESVRVTGGSVIYTDAVSGVSASVSGVDFSADGRLSTRTGAISLEVGSGRLSRPGAEADLSNLLVSATLADGRLDPVECRVAASPGAFNLSGAVTDLFGEPLLDLSGELDLDLPTLRRLAGLEPELTGTVSARLRVEGPVADPSGSLAIGYDGGGLFGYAVDRIGAEAKLFERLVSVEDLTVISPAGELHADGWVDLTAAFADGLGSPPSDLGSLAYGLNLMVTRTDLALLVRGEGGMAGSVRGMVSVSGRGVDPETAEAKGEVSLSASGLDATGVARPVDAELTASGGLAEGVARLSALDLTAGGDGGGVTLSAEGRYGLSDGEMAASVRLDAPRLRETLAAVGLTGISGDARLSAEVSGSATAPEGKISASGNNLGVGEIRIGDLRLSALSNAAGTVSLETLTLTNGDSKIRAGGTVKGLGKVDAPALDLRVDLSDVSPTDFLATVPVRGRISGRTSVGGTVAAPSVDLTLNAAGMSLPSAGVTVGEIALAAGFVEGAVQVRSLTVDNGESSLSAEGTVRVTEAGSLTPLAEPVLDMRVSSDRLVPSDFLADLETAGRLSLNATADGPMMQPRVSLEIHGEGLAAAGVRVGDLDLAAGLDETGAVTLSRLDLRNGSSALSAEGRADLFAEGFTPVENPPIRLTATLDRVSPADFLPDLEAGGTVNGTVTVDGRLNGPTAGLDLTGRGLRASELTVGDVDLLARLSDSGQLEVERMTVENQGSTLDVSGTADLIDPETRTVRTDPPVDLILSAEIEPGDFLEGAGGAVSVTGRVAGQPSAPTGHLEISGTDLRVPAGGVTQTIPSVAVSADLQGDRVAVDPLSVTLADGETLTATGWYALDGGYRVDLATSADGINLDRVAAIAAAEILDGTLKIDLSGEGRVDAPALEGTVRVTGLRVRGKPLSDLRLAVDLADGVARVDGGLDFDLEAAYHLEDGRFSAGITLPPDGLDLAPYLRLADLTDFSGRLSGRVTAEGNGGAPMEATVSADLGPLSLRREDQVLVSIPSLSARLADGTLELDPMTIRLLEAGQLALSGRGAVLPAGAGGLDFKLSGEIPLRVARPFLPDFPDLDGDLNLSASVRGTADDPAVRADLTLDGVATSITGLAQQLHDLNGRVELTPEEVRLEEINGALGEGRFSINGEVALDGFTPARFDVGLSAESLPVGVEGMIDLLIKADIRMTGPAESAEVAGSVVLLEGTYYKDVNLYPIGAIGKKKRETDPTPPPRSDEDSGFPGGTALDIGITARQPLVVDNNLAYLEVRPDLRVHGTLTTPLLAGRAEIRTGNITYQDKTFEVTRGMIDFLNPYKIEPTLDLAADVEVREWTVILKITGTPDQLSVSLDSRPSESEGDILSLLMFGRTRKELIEGEGGTAVAPAQMVADIVSKTVGEDIKNATGLDIVELEVGENGGESAGGDSVKVTVGKELSRRMAVKYSFESSDGETVGRTTAEYKFLENLLISGYQDNKGTIGGEILFRLELR